MAVTLRRDKGSELTHDQLDDNFAVELNQTTHGMAVGDIVYRSGASAWAKAKADAASTIADGIVVDVEDANNLSVATINGTVVTVTSHGLGSTGTMVYLSQGTAGAMTATKPTSGIVQVIGRVLDTNTVIFRLGPIYEET